MSAPPRIKCNQCGGDFQPRNWMRHRKACNRMYREQRGENPFRKGDRVKMAPGSTEERNGVILHQAVGLTIYTVQWDGIKKPTTHSGRDLRWETRPS